MFREQTYREVEVLDKIQGNYRCIKKPENDIVAKGRTG